MESRFSQKSSQKSELTHTTIGIYSGKMKTGSKKTKTKSAKTKPAPLIKKDKPLEKATKAKQGDDSLLKNKETMDTKKIHGEKSGESKLQWRKETKKSQRSFSKNKEREYIQNKSKTETYTENSRKPFGNSFQKNEGEISLERKSSWDKNSVKPGTGFKKSKTGYKGDNTGWNKSSEPKKITRKWDTPVEKNEIVSQKGKASGYQGKNPSLARDRKIDKKSDVSPVKNKKTFPKPTWEMENKIIDKKTLIDPTK